MAPPLDSGANHLAKNSSDRPWSLRPPNAPSTPIPTLRGPPEYYLVDFGRVCLAGAGSMIGPLWMV
jgi:hypothetical protein